MRLAVLALIGLLASFLVGGALLLLSLWSAGEQPRRFEPVVIEHRDARGEAGRDREGDSQPAVRKDRRPGEPPRSSSDGSPDERGGSGEADDGSGSEVVVVGPGPTRVDEDDDGDDDRGDDDNDRDERNDSDD